MAKIVIRRKKKFCGCAQNHDVYLSNTFVGNLKNGGILEIPVQVGTHTLSFNSTMIKFGDNATFKVVVNEPDEVVELKTKFGMSGYEVEYADNKPHISTFNVSNETQDYKEYNMIKKKTITCKTCGAEISPKAKRCPHCGEMTPNEKFSQTVIGFIVAPFIAILIGIAIRLYFGFFFRL